MKNSSANETTHFYFIDYLRVIATLMVLWSHLGGWWLSNQGISSRSFELYERLIAVPLQIYQNGGHFGVLIFFLITGFVTARSSTITNRLVFMIKKILRLMPTLIVALLITYILSSFSQFMGMRPVLGVYTDNIIYYLSSILLLNNILVFPSVLGVIWTLIVDVFYYMLQMLPFRRLHLDGPKSTMFMMLLLTAFMLLAPLINIIYRISQFAIYVYIILTGRMIFYINNKDNGSALNKSLLVICLIMYVLF